MKHHTINIKAWNIWWFNLCKSFCHRYCFASNHVCLINLHLFYIDAYFLPFSLSLTSLLSLQNMIFAFFCVMHDNSSKFKLFGTTERCRKMLESRFYRNLFDYSAVHTRGDEILLNIIDKHRLRRRRRSMHELRHLRLVARLFHRQISHWEVSLIKFTYVITFRCKEVHIEEISILSHRPHTHSA